MTRDEIIRLARECGIGVEPTAIMLPYLEGFAELVAAAEREACAQIADPWNEYGEQGGEIAARIRARGKAQPPDSLSNPAT